VSTPYEAINQRGRRAGAQVYAVFNDTAYSAVAVTAAAADVAIVFVGAFATEGRDRANLTL
jgi:beta-glucosidase